MERTKDDEFFEQIEQKDDNQIDNPNNDVIVMNPPTNTVTSLYFTSKLNSSDFIVTTWDKQVRYYQISDDVINDNDDDYNIPKYSQRHKLIGIKYHEAPVLDCCWNDNDTNKIYSVGCDRVIKLWDLEKNIFSTMDIIPNYKNKNNVSNHMRKRIMTQIHEWHPKIRETLTNNILNRYNEIQCRSFLNDLISFRVEVDNLAIALFENTLKKTNMDKPTIYLHHAAPIQCIKYTPENNVIITGSWDKRIKFWDCRAKTCCGSLDLGYKIYCMAALTPIITVGLSNNYIQVYDLRNMSHAIINRKLSLKYGLNCMQIFPSKEEFAIGSTQGEIHIETFVKKNTRKDNILFQCGRIKDKEDDKVYSVNTITCHPNQTNSIFITGKSDGMINYWNRITRKPLTQNPKKMILPIVATSFNYNASLLAYATSNDWTTGVKESDAKNHKPQIYIHKMDKFVMD